MAVACFAPVLMAVLLIFLSIQSSSPFTSSITQTRHRHRSKPRQPPPSFSSSSSPTSLSSSSDLTLFSPSKINLFLRIIRKRDDGFHDLASLFAAIGLGDQLHLQLSPSSDAGDTFTCNMPGVPVDSTNLVVRALDLVREKTGNADKKFKINLQKECPAQAGLGGGSGNAATAMWGVNELLGRPATLSQLVEWSGELGSDITFFLSEGTAYCTGRGEIMEDVVVNNGEVSRAGGAERC